MPLLESRSYFKPFEHGWAYDSYKTARAMAWEPSEVPMSEDINDWNSKLSTAEKSLLTQLFRFFTQADADIAKGYFEKYAPRFPLPEVRMMLGAFIDMEANHIDAYSTLIDTLGIPESEYKAFQNYKAMRDKHEYMFESSTGKGIADLAVDLAIFSAFGEGLQLFSSFAILLSFPRRGLLKGMGQIVTWSSRDEALHVESMTRLFHELIKEHPRVWNDETKKRIYDVCRTMVKLEDAFIDQAFSLGEVDGIKSSDVKQYIRYIADRRLLQLGLKPNYKVKENPLGWLDWMLSAVEFANFFETRSTEYSKQEIEGWDNAFDTISPKEEEDVTPKTKSYHLYTMPGCPHCDRAKKLLTDDGLSFTFEQIDDVEERANLKKTYSWKTFPMVFWVEGLDMFFVGGADALAERLKPEERKSA